MTAKIVITFIMLRFQINAVIRKISEDHVTLKTAENSVLHYRNKFDFKMYSTSFLNCNNISQY